MARPSRARRRFHTERIVANRRARFLREQDLSVYIGPSEHHTNTPSPIVRAPLGQIIASAVVPFVVPC